MNGRQPCHHSSFCKGHEDGARGTARFLLRLPKDTPAFARVTESTSPALNQQRCPTVFQRLTRSHSLQRSFLTSHCGVTLGSACRFSSISACETLAIKTEYTAREKKALVLYNSIAIIKLCMCQKTYSRLDIFYKHSRR